MAPSLNQLRYFCELAKAGNFGRAAERLHMSQPPLSRQIAALERELGTPLFMRSSKGVVLTTAGRQFLSDATEILRLVEQAQRNAAATGRGEAGQFTMGFTMCAAYSVVPDLTRRYQRAFPDVDLRVRELMPNALESDLRDGVIDIAISFPGNDGSRFETRPLFREPLNLVLPERHPLARSRKIKVEDLAQERFLIVPRDQVPSLYESIVQCCRAAGFDPVIGLEVYLQQTIVNFVAEGLGIAFVPASMQRSQIKGAVFRKVDHPPMIDQLLYWSPVNKNPCLAGFLALSER
ncbi:LysR family transcriptional regulator [Bradyrhizobium sp. dw_78]|uniref:LysR family transcriptional regulator n=1 Tax=Bradyrhizobium sp. dw_78 TaxID=2719793 RepID=UPI001BD59A85|nr:LysR family transcriptional regulator [Bradyrhizobium sp. dw_78]